MSKEKPFENYQERLDRVISYIYDHLDEDLNLDLLADVACMSRYHWHRVFRAMTGETLLRVIRRLRLNKAANALIDSQLTVHEIAKQHGYKNLASFSRAFKTEHGLSPNEFRALGSNVEDTVKFAIEQHDTYPVKIQNLEGFSAAGAMHLGPYNRVGKAFKDLGGVLAANSLFEKVDSLFVIYHDTPDCRPAEKLRSHVAVSIQKDFPKNLGELDYFDVEGGRFAILEHKGPYATLKTAYSWLYGSWLPSSGEEPRDLPPLEVYINDPRQTPSTELRTDIRLPLVSRKEKQVC